MALKGHQSSFSILFIFLSTYICPHDPPVSAWWTWIRMLPLLQVIKLHSDTRLVHILSIFTVMLDVESLLCRRSTGIYNTEDVPNIWVWVEAWVKIPKCALKTKTKVNQYTCQCGQLFRENFLLWGNHLSNSAVVVICCESPLSFLPPLLPVYIESCESFALAGILCLAVTSSPSCASLLAVSSVTRSWLTPSIIRPRYPKGESPAKLVK